MISDMVGFENRIPCVLRMSRFAKVLKDKI